jgi:hypothetical protein
MGTEPPFKSRFLLGTHQPTWLRHVDIPLFVSHTRLHRQRRLPRAHCQWALDSGAFSEIAIHGEYRTTPRQYATAVARYRDEIGNLDWAAPQDHMCEPSVLARSNIAGTVTEAQDWTVRNVLTLRSLDPDLPIIPVLQGQTLADYRRHVDAYNRAGLDLAGAALVGLGSVCRRQATTEIAELVAALAADGLRLHGFGVKTSGLARYGWCLASADSLAWSYRGRRIRPCPHTGAVSCANCLPHALAWRQRIIIGAEPVQLGLGI